MSVVTPTILSAGKEMDPLFELISIDIVKEVNRIPYAQLILLDGSATKQEFVISNDAFFEPGKKIEIKLRYETESDESVFKGVVVGLGVQADSGESLLTVELKDPALKMASTRKSAVYKQMTDDKIIGKLISNNGLTKGTVAVSKITHKELVQYNCTDWDFMLTRAEVLGWLVVANDGEISASEIKLSGSADHTFEYGIDIVSFQIEADVSGQLADAKSVAWDVKTQKLTKPAKGTDLNLTQGNLDGAKIAKSLGFEAPVFNSTVTLEPEELTAWGTGSIARSRLSLLRGRVEVPGTGQVNLLDSLAIKGVGDRFNGTSLVTGIRHRVQGGSWQTDIQLGLSAERFALRPDVVDAQAAGLLPGVNGLQIGVVAGFEEDPDKQFRVKVIVPAIDESEGTVWARLATPDAGPGRGYFFFPEPGDEVVLGFLNDDPRNAIILGSLYSSANTPADSVSMVSAENTKKAIVTKTGTTIGFVDADKSQVFIETPAGNKILLDDDGQMAQLVDENGNEITLSPDGITITSAKDFIVKASGKVAIEGSAIDLK